MHRFRDLGYDELWDIFDYSVMAVSVTQHVY